MHFVIHTQIAEVSLIVRKVQVSDALGITNILNPIIQEGRYTILDRTFTLEEEKEFIRGFPETGVFNVALLEQSSTVAGFQNVEPFATYTRAFDHVGVIGTYVGSQYRKQGIAKSLFESTFKLAKLKGYEKLFAYVRGDNERALSTYINQGFVIIGTAKNHAKMHGEFIDEVLIEKFI